MSDREYWERFIQCEHPTFGMKRTTGFWIPEELGIDRNVWMLAFECAGIAAVGGLGAVIPNLARGLAKDLNVSVFMPSHGRHLDAGLRKKYGFHQLPSFIADGYRIGQDGRWYHYLIGIEKGTLEGVDYYLFKGLEPGVSRFLDNRIVYDHDITFEKMSLTARGLRAYIDHLCVNNALEKLPHVLHIHDWHMVPTGISVKQDLEERRYACPVVFTIHLLSRERGPWEYMCENWSQIKDEAHYLWFYGKHHFKGGYREVWDALAEGFYERFGAYEADLLTTVSHSYLDRDVLSFVGEGVRGKSSFIYNGCDWDYKTLREGVLKTYGEKIRTKYKVKEVNRWDMRRFLLTEALRQMKPPDIVEDELRWLAHELTGVGAIGEQGKVDPFEEDGPLILMTGRLDKQKGVDTLLRSVPVVTKSIPDARFLLMLLPIFQRELINEAGYEAARYYDNVRLILGRAPDIYFISYLSSDVYVMPSRWEPFGITALEAMVTGSPVVGGDVGGIKETVLEIHKHGEKATGQLVSPEDPKDLAKGILCFLSMMKADELASQRLYDEAERYASMNPYRKILALTKQNLRLGSTIRKNCMERVNSEFRWSNAAGMAVNCYKEARKMAEYRALACFQ